jgi:peroxiredoxin
MFFTPIALAIWSLFSGPPHAKPAEESKTSMQPASGADFSLIDTAGHTVTLADFKGKFVVLDMWASFCRPCMVETQPTHELQEKYKDKNLVWVYISFDKDRREWLNAIKREHLNGVHLLAGTSSEKLKRQFHIEGIPFYIWIDENGKIVEENAPRPSENAARKIKFYLKDKE